MTYPWGTRTPERCEGSAEPRSRAGQGARLPGISHRKNQAVRHGTKENLMAARVQTISCLPWATCLSFRKNSDEAEGQNPFGPFRDLKMIPIKSLGPIQESGEVQCSEC